MNDSFLSSREWQVLRMQALERDGAKCACCGSTAAQGAVMNVDHIKPRLRHPELALTLSNLQVLCSFCNRGKGNTFETNWRNTSMAPEALMAAAMKLPTFDPSAPRATPEQEAARARQVEYVQRTLQCK